MCVCGVKWYTGIFICVLSGGVVDIIFDGRRHMSPCFCVGATKGVSDQVKRQTVASVHDFLNVKIMLNVFFDQQTCGSVHSVLA